MESVNREVKATYYSLVETREAVLLVAQWMTDTCGATRWIELDREPHREGESGNAAYDRLHARKPHLLPMQRKPVAA